MKYYFAAVGNSVGRGVALQFWDADDMPSLVAENIEILPPRVVQPPVVLEASTEMFGVADVQRLRLTIDISSPECPAELRAAILTARRLGVFLAHGWVTEPQDPFRYVSATRVFVGILDHDAPVTVEPGRGVELVFTDVASYVASELVLPSGLSGSDVLDYDGGFLATYLTPAGRVTYWLRGQLVRVRALLAQMVQNLSASISDLLPPNLSLIGYQGGYGLTEQATQTCFLGDVFVDGEWGNIAFHEEPGFWVSAHELYVPLSWRPYAGGDSKVIEDLLLECRSLRDFWRRIAEMTLYNHALWLEQSGIATKSGDPTVLTDNFVLRAGSLSIATVDFHSDAVFNTDASYVIERVEMLTHQLRAVRVKVDEEYAEERYARRGLDWGATPPFTAGVVRAEDTYYFRNGLAQFTDKLPLESAFPFLVRWASQPFTFSLARRLRVRHYRDDTVTMLSGDSGTDAFGNTRGYRYAYTVTYAGSMQRYVRDVAHKASSAATLLRTPFPVLGGWDFPEGTVYLNPYRKATQHVVLRLDSLVAEPMRALGRQLVLNGRRLGTIVGVKSDFLRETTELETLIHDIAHDDAV
jgi:hypothetical protein